MIQQDGVWGRHVSSAEAFQSGDYPEAMWETTFRKVPLGKIKPSSILVLGSGAGSSFFVLQQILKKENFSCELVGVEWDPVMTHIGRVLYGDTFSKKNKWICAADLQKDQQSNAMPYRARNIIVMHNDAKEFFATSQAKHSLIIIDLFRCFEVIPLVSESSFIQNVYEHLLPQGHIIINAYNTADRLIHLWERAERKIEKIFFKKNTVLWIH